MLILIWLSGAWVITRLPPAENPVHLHQKAIFYYAITAILLGAQLFIAGLLAELMTALNSRTLKHYSIAEQVPARRLE